MAKKRRVKKTHVYKLTNKVTGRVYIGISRNPIKRFAQHRQRKIAKLGLALAEYGAENFELEILRSCEERFEAAYIWEIYYIGLYNSIENGYNSHFDVTKPLFYGTLKKIYRDMYKVQHQRNVDFL